MADEDLERLKIAFALYIGRAIVNADKVVHEDEIRFVQRMFPLKMLESVGFVERGGTKLTPVFQEARDRAMEELPRRLTLPEKEEFVAWFRQVCAADGVVDAREEALVAKAEEMLALRR